jgi:hypothetical protein
MKYGAELAASSRRALPCVRSSSRSGFRFDHRRNASEATAARFCAGKLARIDAVLDAGEKRSDFFRDTVETEIKRSERKKRPRARRKA